MNFDDYPVYRDLTQPADEKQFRDAIYSSDLLVVTKFRGFTKKAAAEMEELKLPLSTRPT